VLHRYPDSYHTAYNLSGLSSAQHKLVHSKERFHELCTNFLRPSVVVRGKNESEEEAIERLKDSYASLLAWTEIEGARRVLGNAENELVRLEHTDADGSLMAPNSKRRIRS
jgi:protein farnesyltransferase subunit beta